MHSFLHASSETSSLNKIMKLCALPSNLSKMIVPKMNEEVEITSAYQNNERFISTKEKSLYAVQNYVAKPLAIISQMRDAVLMFKLICHNDTEIIQEMLLSHNMFHFVAQNLALRRLCKKQKILIQNICLGMT